MRPLLLALTLITAMAGLAACGNKGPLYLPAPQAEPQTTPPPANTGQPELDKTAPAPPVVTGAVPPPANQPGPADTPPN